MPIPSSSVDTLLYLSTVVACHCRRVRARHNLVQLSELILKMRVAEHSGPTCLCSKGSCKLCSSRPACLVLARFMLLLETRPTHTLLPTFFRLSAAQKDLQQH